MLSQLRILTCAARPTAGDGARASRSDRGLQGAILGSGDRDDQSLPGSVASHLQLGDRSRSPRPRRRSIGAASESPRRPSVAATGGCPKPEEQQLLDACKLLNEPTRSMAKLTWDDVHEIRARAQAGVEQREIAATFNISRPLCSEIVRGHIWNPDVKLTTGDEMRDRHHRRAGHRLPPRRDAEDPEQARRLATSLDPNPEGALEDRSSARHPVRGRQPTREAVAPARIPRTGGVRVRRGNDRRVRG